MALVTTAEVLAIVPFVVTDASLLQPFVDIADLIITEDLSTSGLSSARLTQIELYLAAHFAVVTYERGGLTSQKLGEGEERYNAPKATDGLSATRFGQQAVMLDTSGTLSKMASKPVKAQFRVVGPPPSSENDSFSYDF